MGYSEKKIINETLLNLSPNKRLFRCNCGMGWTGDIIKKTGNILLLKNPRPFRGFPKGFPDLLGWTEIEITPDMIGQKIAVFTAEEIKATGGLSSDQKEFRNIIKRMGGIFRVLS